jgi:Phage-integrase repeat unit
MEWVAYNSRGERPPDIPSAPDQIYQGQGWKSWGDWVGTGRHQGKWRPFKESRVFVRALHLKSSTEWREYIEARKLPGDIPTNPHKAYPDDWRGYGDWLGTGYIANAKREYRPFKAAREYARGLGLRSSTEWNEFSRSGRLPPDIPNNAWTIYANDGWAGMSDWLGTLYIHPRDRKYREFPKARDYARGLTLKSKTEWEAHCKSRTLPSDIPQDPRRVYRDKGWKGFGDWLATGNVKRGDQAYRPFTEARTFVRGLGLSSRKEWQAFTKSGKLPSDILANPNQTYRNDGWDGMRDWLGAGRRRGGWPPFEETRAIARTLGLTSNKQWRRYVKLGQLSGKMPADPDAVYRGSGWISWPDWLGTGRARKRIND